MCIENHWPCFKITLQFWYSWRYQLKAFSDNFRMVAVDLRYCKKYIMICKIQIASSQTVLCTAATTVKHTWVIISYTTKCGIFVQLANLFLASLRLTEIIAQSHGNLIQNCWICPSPIPFSAVYFDFMKNKIKEFLKS